MIIKFLLTVLVFISLDVYAKDIDDAVDAMRSGDFAEAYCIMRPLAESGDADSQYNIGWMYINGYGLRINDSVALQWWEKASEQGHTDASFSIAMLYNLGDGNVPKDLNKAIDYYLLSAVDGQEDAITILKSMMLRNDQEISRRLHSIINDHGLLFGSKRQVKANKLNVRDGPSTESKVISQLVKEDLVLELNVQGTWSQIVILDNKAIEKTVWVYNPMLETVTSDVDKS